MEQYEGVAYRGLAVQEGVVVEHMPVGKEVVFNIHSSSSRDLDVAKQFSSKARTKGKERVIFKLEGGPKANIQPFVVSGFKYEKEVVIRAGTKYTVVAHQTRYLDNLKRSKYIEVHLRYTGGP